MKRTYVKPTLEVFLYSPEHGFAYTIALENTSRDYVLIEGSDRGARRASEEVTEYTDEGGQYMTGEWD